MNGLHLLKRASGAPVHGVLYAPDMRSRNPLAYDPQGFSLSATVGVPLATAAGGSLLAENRGNPLLDAMRGSLKGVATGGGGLAAGRLASRLGSGTGGALLAGGAGSLASYLAAAKILKLLGIDRKRSGEKPAALPVGALPASEYLGLKDHTIKLSGDLLPARGAPGPVVEEKPEEKPPRPRPLLQLLLAKTRSDQRAYPAKHAILRKLIRDNPQDFYIDERRPGGIVGLTHKGTGFRIHMPEGLVPVPLEGREGGLPTKQASRALSQEGSAAPLRSCARIHMPEGLVPVPLEGCEGGLPTKQASGALEPVWQAAHLAPSSMASLYGGATPLAAMLAGSVLGGAGGYGMGWLGEKLLGKKVLQPGGLRRQGMLLGGLAGLVPGAYLGSVGQRMATAEGKDQSYLQSLLAPNRLMGTPDTPVSLDKQGARLEEAEEDLYAALGGSPEAALCKLAEDAGSFFAPSIQVDQFNRALWQDPYTPPGIRAATSGLLSGASALAGSPWVSRANVLETAANLAGGAFKGLVAGGLAARTLDALFKLSPEATQGVQQAGLWAGVLSSVIPRVFG